MREREDRMWEDERESDKGEGEILTEVDFSPFLALKRSPRGTQAVRKIHPSHHRSPKHINLFAKYNPYAKRRWKSGN